MRNVAIGIGIIIAIVVGAYFLAPKEGTPPPGPTPTTTHSCATQGSCRNGESCPAGTECSGLPAYGCYPVGCPYPICLASDTLIATPNGEVRVTELLEGMLVWSRDRQGRRITVPVMRVAATEVPSDHRVLHVVLQDGRNLRVSSGHPTADGRFTNELRPGDTLDDSTIVTADSLPYDDNQTYDFLPAGETGFYWANGILMGSTLK